MSSKKTSYKMVLIVVGIVIAVIVGGLFAVNSFPNRAIALEEKIKSAQSDIKVQEKARYDTVYNLADCVMQYDEHEAETLKALAESMSSGDTSVEDVQTVLSAVTYAYPELKSNGNYQKFMDTLTLTERTIAEYRETYNRHVESYNTYCRRFPVRQFLDFTGYEVKEYHRLDFDVSEDAPTDLFNRRQTNESD